MISAAEALKKSKSVDEILLATFSRCVEERINAAVALGKREAMYEGGSDMREHMTHVTPTFLALEETLVNLGYTVTRSVTSRVPRLIIRW